VEKKLITFKDIDCSNAAIESLNYCNPELFPNIYFLLKATLPVSTKILERTFSPLNASRYFYETIGQERLTSLALLSAHKDVTVNSEELLNQFALQKR
jgi:hypothetical protein